MGIIKEQIVNSGHGKVAPEFLVVHSTANPGATAQNHAQYWKSNDTGKQYAVHYVSDWTEALHTMRDNRKAWHVGNANSRCIGIEICEAKNRAQFDAGIEIAAKACADILRKHGWGTDKMVTHDWCRRNYGGTDHTDPLPYFKKWGLTWAEFVAMVDLELSGKKPAGSAFKPYKVKVTASVLNVRSGAGTGYKVNTTVKKGDVFTISAEKMNGTTKWGKLKSGVGWISLAYTEKVRG